MAFLDDFPTALVYVEQDLDHLLAMAAKWDKISHHFSTSIPKDGVPLAI